MVAITISRQYGSGGRKIATRVAEILGYRFFDKRLMLEVAHDVGLSESELIDYSEEDYTIKNFFARLFGVPDVVAKISTRTRSSSGEQQKLVQALDAAQAVELVRTSVRAAYKRGEVVIVGRGGQAILQDQLDVFHVRVVAPMNTRISRLTRFEGILRINAPRIIEERDRANQDYAKRFFNINLDDPMLYHMIINTGKWNVETAAQMIVNSYKQFQQGGVAQASG